MELKSKLTPIKLTFEDKYFYLRLRTSKATFDNNIKNDRLKFELDKGNGVFEEFASKINQGGHDAYYLNYLDEQNGFVSFAISSEQGYGTDPREKGTYKVTKVWLSSDTTKKNLLIGNSNTVDVK
ncbi:hypothetical protein JM47_02290 [Ureaplasma diversum]|uniref:Uncharacterized protein n=1 Tax=Ureaplasma diversum TaxID=42094 RepID=A0A0C5RC10_9BACT|nr:hypothetical protein [Ureaplasma diversum]AJQ45396.1 hypothetical protein JM47_02290 [Ureaplasma diversum]